MRGGWWDEECRRMKRGVRAELKRWKKRGGAGGKYKEMRRRYREHCKEKKRERKMGEGIRSSKIGSGCMEGSEQGEEKEEGS